MKSCFKGNVIYQFNDLIKGANLITWWKIGPFKKTRSRAGSFKMVILSWKGQVNEVLSQSKLHIKINYPSVVTPGTY